MSIDWFRKPTEGDAGTLNACYNALDRHVVRGHAVDVALVDPETGKPVTYARLLTQAAAFGGALQILGVAPGSTVGWSMGLSPRGIVALLGCMRIGAVPVLGPMGKIDESSARVVVVDHAAHLRHFPPHEGRTVVVGAGDVVEEREDIVPWRTLMQAGGAQPAGCEEVPGDALLWTTIGVDRDATVADLLALGEDPAARGDAPGTVLGALLRGGQWSEALL